MRCLVPQPAALNLDPSLRAASRCRASPFSTASCVFALARLHLSVPTLTSLLARSLARLFRPLGRRKSSRGLALALLASGDLVRWTGRSGELGPGLPPLRSSVKDGGRFRRLRRATRRRTTMASALARKGKGYVRSEWRHSAGHTCPPTLCFVATLAACCPIESRPTAAATRRSCRHGRRHPICVQRRQGAHADGQQPGCTRRCAT